MTADLLLYGSGVGTLPPVLATWRFQVPTSEAYEVYAKWPESAGHASDAGYRIFHASGASTAVVRSQRQGGGQWTRLGRFDFEAGTEHWVELSDQGDGGVVADAVYVVKAAQSYDSYSWAPSLPSAGDYAVYAKWAADAGRASDAVYGIYHAGGLAEVAQDQRAGAGQWAYLGTWAFDPAGSPLVVLAGGSDGTLSADALRFVGAGPAPADLRFVLGDHLGTPQKLTDNTGALVWDRIQTPFGLDHSVTGAAATPVRFPGQYADAESGLSYNYYRDYDPSLGRYIQSDPIGLAGGLNTYGYVGGNPLGYVDPTGEFGRATNWAPVIMAAGVIAAAAAQHCINNGIIPSSPPSWPSWVPPSSSPSDWGVPDWVFSEEGVGEDPTDEPGAPTGTDGEKAGDKPFVPEEYWERKLPKQVTPGTETIETWKKSSGSDEVYKKTGHYDEHGRLKAIDDYTDHGRPNDHPNPHHHRFDPKTGEQLRNPATGTKIWPGTYKGN